MASTPGPTEFNEAYVGPRPDILSVLPESTTSVLDVGCSDGTLGASIKHRFQHASVVGLELSADMGQVAATRLDAVHIGDIEAESALQPLSGRQFDTVIFADILEHLRDPWKMLERIRPLLAPGGVVVASLPNVRHWDTIYHLVIKGVWPYRTRGIHDSTHLRFMTRSNIEDLFTGAGFAITTMVPNYRLFERPHPWNRYSRYVAIPGLAPFLAFQYVLVARLKDTPDSPRTDHDRSATVPAR